MLYEIEDITHVYPKGHMPPYESKITKVDATSELDALCKYVKDNQAEFMYVPAEMAYDYCADLPYPNFTYVVIKENGEFTYYNRRLTFR